MSLHSMYYNFLSIHKTLRTTPALAPHVSKKLLEMSDIIEMLEAWESVAAKWCRTYPPATIRSILDHGSARAQDAAIS